MIDDSPAVPLLVRADGRIEAPERLAAWLGLDRAPGFLSELSAPGKGLTEFQLSELTDAVRRTQKTAAPFRMVVDAARLEPQPRAARASGRHRIAPGRRGAGVVVRLFRKRARADPHARRDRARAQRFRRAGRADRGRAAADVVPRAPTASCGWSTAHMCARSGHESAEAVIRDQVELVEPVDGVERGARRRAGAHAGPRGRAHRARPRSRASAAQLARVRPAARRRRGRRLRRSISRRWRSRRARSARSARRSACCSTSCRSGSRSSMPTARTLLEPAVPAHLRAAAATPRVDPPEFDRWLDMARDARRVPETRDFPPGGASSASGSRPARRWTTPGRSPTAPTCGSSPSRCPTAGWCWWPRTAPSSSRSRPCATRCCAPAPRRSTACSNRWRCSRPTGGCSCGIAASRDLGPAPRITSTTHPRIEALLEKIGAQARAARRSARRSAKWSARRRSTGEQRGGRVAAVRRAHARVRRGPAARRQRPAHRARRDRSASRRRMRCANATRRWKKPTRSRPASSPTCPTSSAPR